MPRLSTQIKLHSPGADATSEARILRVLGAIAAAGPAGHAVGLHVGFNWPRYMLQGYSRAWQDIYAREALVARDPTVVWGFANTGWTRWSDIAELDTSGMFARAADHGLRHGCTVAIAGPTTRTIASFAHDRREFTDGEIIEVAAVVAELHALTEDDAALPPAIRSRLAQMSVRRAPG